MSTDQVNTTHPRRITIRELARNTRAIKEAVKRGEQFVVYEKTMPVFTIYPALAHADAAYGMRELKKLRGCITAKSKDTRSIDDIVYGG